MRSEQGFLPATVRRIEDVALGVRLVGIVPAGGARRYDPGAHLQLSIVVGAATDTHSHFSEEEKRGNASICACLSRTVAGTVVDTADR
jgi:hypothetical protein